MRKSRDSVRGVSESANCTWREKREEEGCINGSQDFAVLVPLLTP